MTEFFQTIFEWYMANLNYYTITLLMFIEGSFIPLPSEVVIPFAAYKAAQGEMNFGLVLFFGTLGALLGSLFNYYFAIYLGRPLIYRFAKTKYARVFLITAEKIEEAEAYFNKNGKTSTFIGRLIPGIRQLISIPAGLARMNMRDFVLYTFLGAGIWNLILALVGYYMYEAKDNIIHYIGYLFLGLGALFVLYLVLKPTIQKKFKK